MAVRGIFLFITIRIFSTLGAKEVTDDFRFKKMEAVVLQTQSDVHHIRRTLDTLGRTMDSTLNEMKQRILDNNLGSALQSETSAVKNEQNSSSDVRVRREADRNDFTSLFIKAEETSNDVKTLIYKLD